jgi:hypothetical protein
MRWHDARWVIAVALSSSALVAACGPDPVPDAPNEAALSVHVGADGSGVVVVALGGEPDQPEVAAMADTIGGEVFVGRPATSTVKGNGGVTAILEFTSRGVFEAGDAPTIVLDTRRLCDDLIASGMTDVDVRLELPNVGADRTIQPAHSESGGTWHVRSCAEAPHGNIVLRPDPGQFWRGLLLVVIVVASNVALAVIGSGVVRTRRWATIVLSAVAVIASLLAIVGAAATAGDDLEVAGRMGHGVNHVYFVASLLILVLGPIVAVVQPLYWRLPREQRPRLRRRAAAG